MLIKFVLMIASVLSLAFSLMFWGSLGTGILQIMLLTLAFILEASKWFAWKQCQQALQDCTLVTLVGSGSLFLILLAMSISSSSLQLHNCYLSQKEGALQNSTRYKNLRFQIEQQRTQIAALLKSAQDDLKNGYRNRAQNVLKQDIVQAQNMLSELIREQSAGDIEVQNVPLNALIHSLSKLFGRNMELILCFILGGLLDIVLAFLLWIGNKSTKTCSGNIQKTRNNSSLEGVKQHNSKQSFKTNFDEVIGGDLGKIVSLLKERRCSPTVRAIKEVARIGTGKARALLEQLAEEGLLVRKNLRYQLAQSSR